MQVGITHRVYIVAVIYIYIPVRDVLICSRTGEDRRRTGRLGQGKAKNRAENVTGQTIKRWYFLVQLLTHSG